jgi:flagellar hook protein FlgE
VLGQIQIAKFVNPSGLKPLGNNLMAATASSGQVQVVATRHRWRRRIEPRFFGSL